MQVCDQARKTLEDFASCERSERRSVLAECRRSENCASSTGTNFGSGSVIDPLPKHHLTVKVPRIEVLLTKLVSPLYFAVIVLTPAVLNVVLKTPGAAEPSATVPA